MLEGFQFLGVYLHNALELLKLTQHVGFNVISNLTFDDKLSMIADGNDITRHGPTM